MAFYDLTHTATVGRLRRVVTQFAADLMAWREERATRAALGKLTDRELNDIGLKRGDLDAMSGPDLRNG